MINKIEGLGETVSVLILYIFFFHISTKSLKEVMIKQLDLIK